MDSRQRDERAAAQRSLDFNAISIQAIRWGQGQGSSCYRRNSVLSPQQRDVAQSAALCALQRPISLPVLQGSAAGGAVHGDAAKRTAGGAHAAAGSRCAAVHRFCNGVRDVLCALSCCGWQRCVVHLGTCCLLQRAAPLTWSPTPCLQSLLLPPGQALPRMLGASAAETLPARCSASRCRS